MEYITENVDDALNGQLRHPPETGRPVLVVNENVGIAAIKVLSALGDRPELAMKHGDGIVVRGADRRWRKVTNQEIANIIREEFVVARLEVSTSGEKRLKIVEELPRTFPATVQQTRWWGNDVWSWFQRAA
jgi:hypothetical protein